jgi:hypothetical protein
MEPPIGFFQIGFFEIRDSPQKLHDANAFLA